MSNDTWIERETSYQEKLTNMKVHYDPCMTITTTVLRGRNISVGFLHDLFDTPDSKVYVRCDAATGRKKFKTKVAPHTSDPEWNESFTFILPNGSKDGTIQVDVYEADNFRPDPHLASVIFQINTLVLGETKALTLQMKRRGEVDIELLKQWRVTPDCRMSLGLSKEEQLYRINRKPKTMRAIQNLIGQENGPKSLDETPTIALAITGGGYRAVATTCGAMEALEENGIVDTLMYIAGLSGSSWYLSTAYQHESVGDIKSLIKHHDWIRERSGRSLYSFLLDPGFLLRYRDYRNFKIDNHQETTLVDIFGFSLGETFLDNERPNQTLSSMKSYVETAKVPFPIMSCAHVHENLPMSVFWDEVELTPIEISFPGYGINIPANKFNSRWGNGILQQDLPEPPLHYMMGASGSAFAILWNKIDEQTEAPKEILEHIESINEKHTSSSDEDSSDDHEGDAVGAAMFSGDLFSNFSSEEGNRVREKGMENDMTKDHEPDPMGRGIMIERTAKVHSCATNFRKLQKYLLSTEPVNPETATGRVRNVVNTKKSSMALCDSGIACNLPAVHVMRPQRTVDVLIVVDCGQYQQENRLDLHGFSTAQRHLSDHGIKFPTMSMEKIAEDPFREVYLFEDTSDKYCPVVIWFTLANGRFRRLENPPRRPGYPTPDPVDDGKVKFNDFTITAEATEYSAMQLTSSPLSFDRLRELMKFNISENIALVKEKIASKVCHLAKME